jgi:hypothetical protein
MTAATEFPSFDSLFSDLNNFILGLADDYQRGKINSWRELEEKVGIFFTPEIMDRLERAIPGWKKMASFSDGITLTHVSCVFLGLLMLPEFQILTHEQQQLAKWIVLFHDVEKKHDGIKRDFTHGFRGAAHAARTLANLKFPVANEFSSLIDSWSTFTNGANVYSELQARPIQDNDKLPEIISGIERMFGKNTSAALVTKGVLLHMSVNVVQDYPQSAPLTANEINIYVDDSLRPLLKAMMLSDNEGWVLFYPEVRLKQREETLDAFEIILKAAHS